MAACPYKVLLRHNVLKHVLHTSLQRSRNIKEVRSPARGWSISQAVLILGDFEALCSYKDILCSYNKMVDFPPSLAYFNFNLLCLKSSPPDPLWRLL